jgi:hypothetical protein
MMSSLEMKRAWFHWRKAETKLELATSNEEEEKKSGTDLIHVRLPEYQPRSHVRDLDKGVTGFELAGLRA